MESLITDKKADIDAYCIVLEALAESASYNSGAPQRAEAYMNKLLSSTTKEDSSLLPRCYNAVILVWANSTKEDAGRCVTRAKLWLEKMLKTCCATKESFHAYLHACSKGRSKKKKVLEFLASEAEEMLRYMQKHQVEVDTVTYNYVIRAWTRCRTEQATEHVMDLLREMEQHQRQDVYSNVRPNTVSYCMAMDAWANLAGTLAKKQQGAKQTAGDENKDKEEVTGLYAVRQVEAILEYMHNLSSAGVPNVTVNTVAYNTLISAWTRISGHLYPGAPLQAEKVLRTMREQADYLSYTKVILAWAKSDRANAGIRASWWLDKLWERYQWEQEDWLIPRVSAYNAVILAWSSVGNASKATELLEEMLNENDNDNHSGRVPCPTPNTESFCRVINAWLKAEKRCGNGDACRRAALWLNKLAHLEENYDDTNSSSLNVNTTPELYNGILKAAAHSAEALNGPDLLDLAIETFDKYRASRHRVDHKSYAWLLQVGLVTLGSSDLNEARKTFVEQLFSDCCDDGLVSNVFVRTLANSNVFHSGWTVEENLKTTRQLLSEWPLPPSWSRNVQQAHNLPKWEDSRRTNFNVQEL